MSEDIVSLEFGKNVFYLYKLDPIVPLSILDHYYRKNQDLCIGILLGAVYPSSVHITNSYPLSYAELNASQDEKNISFQV